LEPWPDSAASPLADPVPLTDRVVALPFAAPLPVTDPAAPLPLSAPLAEPEPLPANCRFGVLAAVVLLPVPLPAALALRVVLPVPRVMVLALCVALPELPLLETSRVLT